MSAEEDRFSEQMKRIYDKKYLLTSKYFADTLPEGWSVRERKVLLDFYVDVCIEQRSILTFNTNEFDHDEPMYFGNVLEDLKPKILDIIELRLGIAETALEAANKEKRAAFLAVCAEREKVIDALPVPQTSLLKIQEDLDEYMQYLNNIPELLNGVNEGLPDGVKAHHNKNRYISLDSEYQSPAIVIETGITRDDILIYDIEHYHRVVKIQVPESLSGDRALKILESFISRFEPVAEKQLSERKQAYAALERPPISSLEPDF